MISEQIAADLQDAMRQQDDVRKRTLRSLRTALMQAEIEQREAGEGTLGEEEELVVLRKQAKQRKQSMEEYRRGGREDLAKKEEEELAIIETYLPDRLSDDELRSLLHDIILDVGARSSQDMGRVMGIAMKQLRGRADGHRVQQHVQEILSGLGED